MSKIEKADWFDKLPKVELHLHLEGAIPHSALWELLGKYGGDSAVPDLAALQQRFQYRDFAHFIETWVWKNRFLREYEDFTFIAEAVARDLQEQHVVYAEVFFSPADFYKSGLKTQEITGAIHKGLLRVPGVEVSLVADLVRDFGPEQAALTLRQVNEVRELGVIGIGIGGTEQDYPPELFKGVYEEARRMGFFTSAHAGEAAGPESVWGALKSLKVDRIGHGTRAAEDAELVEYLAEKQIPLEMCPLSNLRTGVVSSIEEHPLRRFFEKGLLVTVNTDDPKMFGNSLAEEFRQLKSKLGFSRAEIRVLILQSVQVSWLAQPKKDALMARIAEDPCFLGLT